jgi:hypothetical protein
VTSSSPAIVRFELVALKIFAIDCDCYEDSALPRFVGLEPSLDRFESQAIVSSRPQPECVRSHARDRE